MSTNDLTATKEAAEIRIVSVDGNRFTIITKPHVTVDGRWTKTLGRNTYSVTPRIMELLKADHTWTPDF